MKFRTSGLLAIATCAVASVLGSAPSGAQNAYIVNSDSRNVSVIDTATNLVTDLIDLRIDPRSIPPLVVVEDYHPVAVAVSPDGSRVCVYSCEPGYFWVIDTASNQVIAAFPTTPLVTGQRCSMAVSPDGSKVYVAVPRADGFVLVFDAATNSFLRLLISVGSFPHGVAATPDGRTVYVANLDSHNVSAIDTATNTVTATIPVGNGPYGIAVTPDGSKVYVANRDSNTVSVIAAATNTVIGSPIAVASSPRTLAVTPDGSKVYVPNGFDRTVSVITTASNIVTATIAVGNDPYGVAVTPDGSKVYVANDADNSVSVIDTASDKVLGFAITGGIGLHPHPFGAFIQPRPPAPRFAGTPGSANCHGQSVAALTGQYQGLSCAAAVLDYPSVKALQDAVKAFCRP